MKNTNWNTQPHKNTTRTTSWRKIPDIVEYQYNGNYCHIYKIQILQENTAIITLDKDI